MSQWRHGGSHSSEETRNRTARAKSYFSQPGFARMLHAVWGRYTSLGKAGGYAVIREATAEECDTINTFFGWYRKPGTDLRISLTEFERELERSAFPFTIPILHEMLTGAQLLTKSDRKSLAEQDWQALFHTVEQSVVHDGVQLQKSVSEWLAGMKSGNGAGYRTLRELWGSSPEVAAQELVKAAQAWQLILARNGGIKLNETYQAGIRLPVLAAMATGNPHALDRSAPAGRLLFQALRSSLHEQLPCEADGDESSECSNETYGTDSLAAREVYRRAGILDDDISSYVHIYNLMRGFDVGPYIMSLRQVEAAGALLPVENIFVVENPAVFSTLSDMVEPFRIGETGRRDSGGSLLLCTSGPASAAALRLLDRYMDEGLVRGKLHYSGDFDIKGIEIGNVLASRYASHFVPWHFDSSSYVDGCKQANQECVSFSEDECVRLGKTQAIWDETLCRTMGINGIKLFQEQLILQLIKDWEDIV
ncbi:DUF2399 domain-containing protein [Paenibacillaceae bacterium]|nr:DUF2399 domain-containing protein [Paenibacillaceae bacterium]